jgi:3-hydroxyisobutyrate dehydrogenase
MAAPLDVSVVGLGNMGTAIAERILDAGHTVRVFNRTAGRDAALVERGSLRLGSAAEALAVADVCLTSLADDAAVDTAVGGPDSVLAGARPGTVLVEMSTISVAASERIARMALEADVHYLRAPVSGNPAAIRSGNAAIVVSGPADVAARCEELLEAIAPAVRYVGEGERARILKLVLQVLIGGTAELLAEALVLGEGAGVDRQTLLEVVAASVVGSRFIDYKKQPLLQDDYSATFTTSMLVKDVDLVLDLARDIVVELPLTTALRTLLEDACAGGRADEDFISLVPHLRERAARARRADDERVVA